MSATVLISQFGCRAVLDFEGSVSNEDYQRLLNFLYLKSHEQVDEFTHFVCGLNNKKINGRAIYHVLSHFNADELANHEIGGAISYNTSGSCPP
jgi:hypothetical protein